MSQDEFTDQRLRSDKAPDQPFWVRRHFAKRRLLRTTLLVGHPNGIASLYQHLLQLSRPAHQVIGCCLSTSGRLDAAIPGLPVLGNRYDVVDVVRRYDVDTVAVLPSTEWDGAALRRLERELKQTRADLVLAPAAVGITPPRTGNPERRPGVPPWGTRGVHGMGKASFDRAIAAVVLVLLAPVLLGVAVCLKVTSHGPVCVRLPRVGRHGRIFHLLKFRTTDDVMAETVDVSGVTAVRAVLRRYSIDELPQILNVLKGDMSLVGPRPRPPSGTTNLGVDEHRLSPVKPGLTGLFHCSTGGPPADGGAMAVSDYVENWSLLLDLTILRATVTAALHSRLP